MCEVTVVIPNYNGEKYLCACLKALYENTQEQIKVIVVDNGSKDNTIQHCKEVYPQVEYIFLDKNYGFCRAVNEGIEAADTPYTLLLNNDTEIRSGFVEELLKTIKRSPNIFSVEAKMIQYDNQKHIDSAGTFYTALGWAFARGKDKAAEGFNVRTKCFAACAGAAIYRKEVFAEIGMFDEQHFAYLEDIDVGYRARIYGYVNVYEPGAEVLHVGSGFSGSRYNAFKTRYSARNNIYLIYKNMPLVQIILNSPLLLLGFLLKICFFCKKGLGKEYVSGIKEGYSLCRREKKVPFVGSNIGHYIQIQLELWGNTIRRLL